MQIYPAIDLLHHKAVRLIKGDYEQVTVYSEDPVSLAKEFETTGATHLHVVDLEGARSGVPAHADLLQAIRENTSLFIEVGGGIRNLDTVRTLIESGVQRVILGTAALEDPAFLAEAIRTYGTKIAVGVDVRNGKLSVRGWKEDTDKDAVEFCNQLASDGIGAIIYTEISRDGMLQGVDYDAYVKLADALGRENRAVQLIASGGLTTADEIEALSKIGMDGAILGKAMYEGKLTLSQALAAAKIGEI